MRGKVLVTGGTGYVGGWLTEALLREGYEVTLLIRKPQHLAGQFAQIIADLTDKEALTEALAGYTFDVVIHLAAVGQMYDESTISRVNFGGTSNLLLALQSSPPSKLIYLSSFKVYGQRFGIINEDLYPASEEPYGISKQMAERFVRGHCLGWINKRTQHVIFRLSNAYGAPKSLNINSWQLLFNDLCRNAFDTGEVRLNAPPDTQLDMIWLGDVCEVMLKAMEHPTLQGTFNLGFGKSTTTGEVAEAVALAYMQYKGEELTIIKQEPAGNIDPLVFDCDRLKAEIPYRPAHYFQQEALKAFELLASNRKL